MRKLIKEAYYLKRVFVTLLVVLATLLSLTLSGCTAKTSKPSLEIKPNDDNTISITADKAGISGGGGADITVFEGQKLVIDSTLNEGEIQIKFSRNEAPADSDASADDILHSSDDPVLDVTVSAAGTTEHTVNPGDYTIMVNVLKMTTGTIIISVK